MLRLPLQPLLLFQVMSWEKHTFRLATHFMSVLLAWVGRGQGVMSGLEQTNKVKYVALCDVDDRRAANTYKRLPKVPKYKDFREVYDKHLGEMDAIMVATPDHMHATIALPL